MNRLLPRTRSWRSDLPRGASARQDVRAGRKLNSVETTFLAEAAWSPGSWTDIGRAKNRGSLAWPREAERARPSQFPCVRPATIVLLEPGRTRLFYSRIVGMLQVPKRRAPGCNHQERSPPPPHFAFEHVGAGVAIEHRRERSVAVWTGVPSPLPRPSRTRGSSH